MKNQGKLVEINIPKDNIFSSKNPAMALPLDLQHVEFETVSLTLEELAHQKMVIISMIKQVDKELKVMGITAEEFEEKFLEYNALLFNRAVVKEALGVYNSPIYANIYYRENARDITRTLSDVERINSKSNKRKQLFKITGAKKRKSEEGRKEAEKILTDYNSDLKVKVSLLKI